MSRKKRICLPDVTYHTYSRCIEKKPLMKPVMMKELMESVLNMAMAKYTFELSGYTLMDNHFHFYIKTLRNGQDISRIMQFIKSRYAQKYNKIMNRTGPFWNERFGDLIIELCRDPETAFFETLLYIFYNPVRSDYVKDPRDYRFGNIKCYLDENYISPVKIILHNYFEKLGDTFAKRVQKFLEYEDKYRKRIFSEVLFE